MNPTLEQYSEALKVGARYVRSEFETLYTKVLDKAGPATVALLEELGFGQLSVAYQAAVEDAVDLDAAMDQGHMDDAARESIELYNSLVRVLSFGVEMQPKIPDGVKGTPQYAELVETFEQTIKLAQIAKALRDILNDDDDGDGSPNPPDFDWPGFGGNDWDGFNAKTPNPHSGKVGVEIDGIFHEHNGDLRGLLYRAKEISPDAQSVVLHLPPGPMPGASIGGNGWADAPRIEHRFRNIALLGHPDGTSRILTNGKDKDYGQSLGLYAQSDGSRCDYLIYDLNCDGSANNAVQVGHYGNFNPNKLVSVRWIRGTLKDAKGAKVRCIRPVSANSCSVIFYGCKFDFKEAKEHDLYWRNAFGDCGFVDCLLVGAGGQIGQGVHRKEEGPLFASCLDAHSIFINCRGAFYNRYPDRAANGWSMQGSCMHVLIRGGVILDSLEAHADAVHKDVQGVMNATDGGATKSHKRPSGRGQGIVTVEGFSSANKGHDRAPWMFSSCEEVVIKDSGSFSRLKTPGTTRHLEFTSGAGKATFHGAHNTPSHIEFLKAEIDRLQVPGLSIEELEDTPVNYKGQSQGALSTIPDGFTFGELP